MLSLLGLLVFLLPFTSCYVNDCQNKTCVSRKEADICLFVCDETGTWVEAKEFCSSQNLTLVDLSDLTLSDFLSFNYVNITIPSARLGSVGNFIEGSTSGNDQCFMIERTKSSLSLNAANCSENKTIICQGEISTRNFRVCLKEIFPYSLGMLVLSTLVIANLVVFIIPLRKPRTVESVETISIVPLKHDMPEKSENDRHVHNPIYRNSSGRSTTAEIYALVTLETSISQGNDDSHMDICQSECNSAVQFELQSENRHTSPSADETEMVDKADYGEPGNTRNSVSDQDDMLVVENSNYEPYIVAQYFEDTSNLVQHFHESHSSINSMNPSTTTDMTDLMDNPGYEPFQFGSIGSISSIGRLFKTDPDIDTVIDPNIGPDIDPDIDPNIYETDGAGLMEASGWSVNASYGLPSTSRREKRGSSETIKFENHDYESVVFEDDSSDDYEAVEISRPSQEKQTTDSDVDSNSQESGNCKLGLVNNIGEDMLIADNPCYEWHKVDDNFKCPTD